MRDLPRRRALPDAARLDSKDEPIEVVMAAQWPDFDRQWSVPGSNR